MVICKWLLIREYPFGIIYALTNLWTFDLYILLLLYLKWYLIIISCKFPTTTKNAHLNNYASNSFGLYYNLLLDLVDYCFQKGCLTNRSCLLLVRLLCRKKRSGGLIMGLAFLRLSSIIFKTINTDTLVKICTFELKLTSFLKLSLEKW